MLKGCGMTIKTGERIITCAIILGLLSLLYIAVAGLS